MIWRIDMADFQWEGKKLGSLPLLPKLSLVRPLKESKLYTGLMFVCLYL